MYLYTVNLNPVNDRISYTSTRVSVFLPPCSQSSAPIFPNPTGKCSSVDEFTDWCFDHLLLSYYISL